MRRLLSLVTVLLASTVVFAAELKKPADRLGRAVILEPAHTFSAEEQDELAAKGIAIQQVLPGGRYIARIAEDAVLEDERIRSFEPLTASRKLHPSMRHQIGRGKTWMDVHVIFHRDIAYDDARQAILAAGGALDLFETKFTPSQRIDARIAPASLNALLADERVLVVAGVRPWKVRTENANSAQLSHVTEVHGAPYGLSGEGVVVALFELAEAQASHPEFGGRLIVHGTGGSASDKDHATHVAGTIGASGVNASAKGMAPKATIHQFCIATPCGSRLSFLKSKEEELTPLGVLVDNNSWGFVIGWHGSDAGFPVWEDTEEYFGAYDLTVGAPLDQISNDKGILFVHSAGNEARPQSFNTEFQEHRHVDDNLDPITNLVFCISKNGSGSDCPTQCNGGCEPVSHDVNRPFDTLGVTAAAKNVIAVGSVAGLLGGPVTVSSFSSRGPAKDGRVKPDVVARGSSVLSTWPTNTYASIGGTSMASPAVTGIAALLVEQWRKTNGGANPSPALLKALIIAGADDMGNPGPDFTYGFGLVNAKRSVDLILADAGTGQRIKTFTFPQGQGTSFESVISVPSVQNLRFVLQWPDKPIAFLGGSDIAEKALVNDLDLRVITPSGEEVRPYVLNKAQFNANATRGANTVDNTEMVEIANAGPGVYRVIATGTNVTEGPQSAVLVSSVGFIAPCLDPWEVSTNNDTPANASGNLVPNASVSGAICSSTDVDHFKFTATEAGPVSVTITATGDTALRATLSGGAGISIGTDIPAGVTRTLTSNAASVPLPFVLRIEPIGTFGAQAKYTLTPQFGEVHGPRRRSVRK